MIKFEPVLKDKLFYDRYEYCVGFELREVSALRTTLDPREIRVLLKYRAEQRERGHQRWLQAINVAKAGGMVNKRPITFPPPWMNTTDIIKNRYPKISDTTINNLLKLAELFRSFGTRSDEYKIVITHNVCNFYTNDTTLITAVKNKRFLKNKTYTQAVIDRPRDTIKLRNNPYSFRTYLKRCSLTTDQKTRLTELLDAQHDIRISPGLNYFMRAPSYYWTQDYYFIDHMGGWDIMLALVNPRLLRKTCSIILA